MACPPRHADPDERHQYRSWEAAGVIFSSPQTISAISFVNGHVTSEGDGYLKANLGVQISSDGLTWTPLDWTVSPPYPYNSGASDETDAFTGPAADGVLAARVAGQVRTRDGSYYWIVKEVQAFGSQAPHGQRGTG